VNYATRRDNLAKFKNDKFEKWKTSKIRGIDENKII
jgi:hypothetical protein